MILKTAENCGEVLFSLNVPESDVATAKELWQSSEQLQTALCSPSVKKIEKAAVIENLFPDSMNYFLKVMCDYGHINKLSQIIEAYENKLFASKKILRATLYYVNKPDAEIVKGFEKMLCGKYGAKAAMLELEQDDNLIGGYKLVVGDTEFDKSIQGAVIAMKSKLIGGV